MTTITLATVAGLIIGIALGATVAGLALMERRSRHWVVCLRLPEELHRRLREEATVAEWSLKAEIISRLQASFGQPNGDQVVDAPRLQMWL
jgi:Arc-like DNA binding domain